MKRLAIIWHSMTGGSKALAEAAAEGAGSAEGIATFLLRADDADPQTLLDADGYIFAFPENLAAVSGVMKAFFDRCYYPCLGQIEGRPYALIVCAGSDGSNAVRQAERIATGWRWKRIADSLIVCTHAQTPEAILAPKIIDEAELAKAHELGAAMAEGLALGVF
ncbi:MAG: flavodoxin family protein [Sphingomonadales bacterium]|jgi:multimeric flavodoxin WrbA|nr:flavodoxin family protein [Sphingomonadales bacterium]MBK9267603.1 flavodoxin family protein [Sphingomonadales bacterium]MBP6433157.1 flavodoxin family protein [Sphingorhabdus sp.]